MKKLFLMLCLLGTIASCERDEQAPKQNEPKNKKEQTDPKKDDKKTEGNQDKPKEDNKDPKTPTPPPSKPEEGKPTPPNNTPEPPKPTPPSKPEAPKAITHYIAKIVITEAGSNESRETTYNYDSNKKLNSIVSRTGNKDINGKLSYTSNSISMEYEDNKDNTDIIKPTIYKIQQDAQGRANRFEETYHFYDGTESRPETLFSYNEQGNCLSYTLANQMKATLEWQANNLTKVRYQGEDTSILEELNYTEIANNFYPDLNHILTWLHLAPIHKSLWSKELGIKSEKLIKSFKRTGKDINELQITCDYELDAQKRPIRITHKYNQQHTTTFVITYLN